MAGKAQAGKEELTREHLEEMLTPKQLRFCEEYVIDWNATRAAIVSGFSEKTAAQQGSRLLTNVKVKAYIELIKSDLERLSGVSALRNLKEYAKIAYSSIAHLHNTWIELKDFECLTGEQKASIQEIHTKTETLKAQGEELTKDVVFVRIKLYDKKAALDSINKMMGYDKAQKIEHTGTDGEPIQIFDWSQISVASRKKLMEELNDQATG